jgi:hypothetical protein
MRFKHNFSADGEYRISLPNLNVGNYTSTLENESTVVIMVDGKIVFRKPLGGPEDQTLVDKKAAAGRDEIMARFTRIPVQVQAGVRDVFVGFIDRSHVESDEKCRHKLQRHRRSRIRRRQQSDAASPGRRGDRRAIQSDRAFRKLPAAP